MILSFYQDEYLECVGNNLQVDVKAHERDGQANGGGEEDGHERVHVLLYSSDVVIKKTYNSA